MYVVTYTSEARKKLLKLPDEIRSRIIAKINFLKPNPFNDLKRLQGDKLWRLRVGEYRAIIDVIVKGKELIILRVGHRRNVYKKK
ncbi:type II toxin-antitoxin system RelE/ParE family toxin [archaeon]|nr:type II toxin-antitoxin system RelE/ParE family toxin [archaeon]